jgi:hypothetical protein
VDHVQTGLDQLKCADEMADTTERLYLVFLVSAVTHALLAVAEEVRKVGLDGWSAVDAAAARR